ncbi:MAG: hypothetical protein IJ588_12570 [Prevotella sp.]|nr:hypothetical protein [Prevotella sp.]
MKRINILLAVTAFCGLFVACSNTAQPSLESKAKHFADSIIDEAKSRPGVPGYTITQSMKYLKTDFASDDICVLQFSCNIDDKQVRGEWIFVRQNDNENTDDVYFYGHIVDTCISRDRFKGIPVSEIINLDSPHAHEILMSLEDKQKVSL